MAKLLVDNIPNALMLYCKEMTRKEFSWETTHCGTFISDWVLTCRGVDPLLPMRALRTQRAIYKHIQFHGGMSKVVSSCLTNAGLERRIGEPKFGDIGLLHVPNKPETAVCVIRMGTKWVMFSSYSVTAVKSSKLPYECWAIT
jgi:hypothetical protein